MLKKIYKVTISIFLLLFSFYYTKVAVDVVRSNNPIMKVIKNEKDKYETEAVNAIIKDDTIIPGVNGVKVEVNESFNKMFRYGNYNDSLYTFGEKKPVISLNDNYDKYIVSGRDDSMKVGLVFTVGRDDSIIDLLTILSDNNVVATFFIDGLFIENNRSFVKNMIETGYEVEVLSYNGNYEEMYFKTAISILNDIKGEKSKFCFNDYKKYRVLSLCKRLELHTVIPSINARNNPYKMIKNNLSSGSIIRMGNSTNELKIVINYIKQRGYSIVRLDDLLSE